MHPPGACRKANSVTLLCRVDVATGGPHLGGPRCRSPPHAPPQGADSGAPPRIVEPVYTDEQYERMLDLIKREGPWGTIISHHFETVDELIATISGVDPARPRARRSTTSPARTSGASSPRTRSASTRSSRTSSTTATSSPQVKSYWGAQYAKPTLMLFNICGPHDTGLTPHLDAVTFRGVRIENTPVWLQNIMGKSGLFNDYLVKMAQVITWWYRGEPGDVHVLARRSERSRRSVLDRADVEQGRRRAERGDVPPRRPGRTARGPCHRGLKNRSRVRLRRRRRLLGRHDRRRGDQALPARPDPTARALERRGLRRHGRGEEGHGPHRRPHPRPGRRHACSPTCGQGRRRSPSRPTRCTTSTSSRR